MSRHSSRINHLRWFLTALLFLGMCPVLTLGGWQAGVARADITPDQPMWMSGYASRDHRAEGTRTKLWGKVLVVEDESQQRIVAITLDLVGIDQRTSNTLRDKLAQEYHFQRSGIAIFCSHTHCGPVVGNNLLSMYTLGEEDRALIREYTIGLIDEISTTVGLAIADLAPAEIGWGQGQAGFAVNRRNNKEPDVPELRRAGELKGPVDHDVPVLQISCGNQIKAIIFGYACHATTLSFMEWCGDYPGFAMEKVEADFPGTMAMFWAGCGADQNPLPRRTVELAQKYGTELGTEVGTVVLSKIHSITGKLAVQYTEPELGYDKIPTAAEVAANLTSTNPYEAGRAKALQAEIAEVGEVKPTYTYPVQTWKLGNGPVWVILGGEVVVDYSLRLKTEIRMKHPDQPVWVAGYANDVMAYIPSRRVWQEGGYEGETSMLYYGRPGKWAMNIEEQIVETVHRQIQTLLAP